MPASEETGSGPVIHDRRRIDPVTGQVRGKHAASKPAGTRGAGRPGPGPEAADPAESSGSARSAGSREDQDVQETQKYPEEVPEVATEEDGGKQPSDLAAQLAERTADLQRLQAEYANYRKRVERDRMAVREQALANVLTELLPVLDDIGRAREHGELTGGFKSVGESLEGIAVKLGLTSFGESGDPFDPTLHEALMHSYSADVTEPTAVQILQPGYKVGERIIRPARVAWLSPAATRRTAPRPEPARPHQAPAQVMTLAQATGPGNSESGAGRLRI